MGKRKICLIGVCILLFLATVTVSALGIVAYMHDKEWSEVNCNISNMTVVPQRTCEKYSTNGQHCKTVHHIIWTVIYLDYTDSRIKTGYIEDRTESESKISKWENKYPIGEDEPCFFNKKECTLRWTNPSNSFEIILYAAIGCAFGFVLTCITCTIWNRCKERCDRDKRYLRPLIPKPAQTV